MLRAQHAPAQVERTLHLLYPNGLAGLRIVDLGCLEGGFSVELARLGMDVTGVEVRPVNFENCMHIKQHVNLPNLKFVNDTAWNFSKYGPFDVVFCYGLLYHLDRPVEFLRLIGNNCKRALFLHTHFAADHPNPKFNLSAMCENEGMPGRWYAEHDGTPATREDAKWSSWENTKSFWLTKGALMQAITGAGFRHIFEQYDFLLPDIFKEMCEGYYAEENRGMFIAVR